MVTRGMLVGCGRWLPDSERLAVDTLSPEFAELYGGTMKFARSLYSIAWLLLGPRSGRWR